MFNLIYKMFWLYKKHAAEWWAYEVIGPSWAYVLLSVSSDLQAHT